VDAIRQLVNQVLDDQRLAFQPLDLEDTLDNIAPAEQQLALLVRQLGMVFDERLDDRAAILQPVLEDEAVQKVDCSDVVGNVPGAEPLVIRPLQRAAETTPLRENHQLALEVATSRDQVRTGRHRFPTSILAPCPRQHRTGESGIGTPTAWSAYFMVPSPER
jgi:hypothetical protein